MQQGPRCYCTFPCNGRKDRRWISQSNGDHHQRREALHTRGRLDTRHRLNTCNPWKDWFMEADSHTPMSPLHPSTLRPLCLYLFSRRHPHMRSCIDGCWTSKWTSPSLLGTFEMTCRPYSPGLNIMRTRRELSLVRSLPPIPPTEALHFTSLLYIYSWPHQPESVSIKICTITWNMGEGPPLEKEVKGMIPDGFQIYVIAVQVTRDEALITTMEDTSIIRLTESYHCNRYRNVCTWMK